MWGTCPLVYAASQRHVVPSGEAECPCRRRMKGFLTVQWKVNTDRRPGANRHITWVSVNGPRTAAQRELKVKLKGLQTFQCRCQGDVDQPRKSKYQFPVNHMMKTAS